MNFNRGGMYFISAGMAFIQIYKYIYARDRLIVLWAPNT